MPAPTRAGVLGMARTTLWWPPSQRAMSPARTPAAMETMSCSGRGAGRAVSTSRNCCGFTARTTTSAAMVAADSAATATENSRRSQSRRSGKASATMMSSLANPFCSKPPIMAAAMLPPPIKPSFMKCVLV